MKVDVDEKTAETLNALAAINGTPPEKLIARAMAKDVQYWREYEEDKASLEEMKNGGGIPQAEMMGWLDDLDSGKDV